MVSGQDQIVNSGGGVAANSTKPKHNHEKVWRDLDATRKFLSLIADPDSGVFEIRMIRAVYDKRDGWFKKSDYQVIQSGYFRNADDAILDVCRIRGVNAYVTVNPVNSALLARSPGKVTRQTSVASDADITKIRWLFVDVDAIRPNGISATQDELDAVHDRVGSIFVDHTDLLRHAAYGCSGNGYWILLRLDDLPNDVATERLVTRALHYFSAKYTGDGVKIDTTVKNASRIMPLVGTMKCKGESIEDRPHRLVTIDYVADPLVPLDLPGWLDKVSPPSPDLPVAGNVRALDLVQTSRHLLLARAAAYIAKSDPAISGQDGNKRTYDTCCCLVHGFGLTIDEAWPILQQYNQRCEPPWEDGKLMDTLTKANEAEDGLGRPRGYLAAMERGLSSKLDSRSEILLGNNEHEVRDKVIDALRNEENLFKRGSTLVEIIRSEQSGAIGGPILRVVPRPQIRDLITKHVNFAREVVNDKGITIVPASPPDYIAGAVESAGSWPGIRPIAGITETPIIRDDGTCFDSAGYDEVTDLLFEPSVGFPPLLANPDQDAAREAARMILEVVGDFPFATQGGWAAWLASVLTLLARNLIAGPTPLFLVTANVPGSGKSKLCDLAATIATGRDMARTVYPEADEEMAKQLLAVALEGRPTILFDNRDAGESVGGAALDLALTSESIRGRRLGHTEMLEVPFKAVIFATGNNLDLGGDALRRTVPIRLESKESRPEERESFKISGDLLAYVRSRRGELAIAALTIIRAFLVAGRPQASLTPMDYPAWSGLIRQAVFWSTGTDPCEGRGELHEHDTRQAEIEAIVLGWGSLCESAAKYSMTARTAIGLIESDPIRFEGLHDALADNQGQLTARGVGDRLRRHKNRPTRVGVLKCATNRDKVAEWRVERPIGAGSAGFAGSLATL